MSVAYSTAWYDLLPWRGHAEDGLHTYDVAGARWVSDGFAGWVDNIRNIPEGGDKGSDGLRAMLGWERRQLVLTDEVANDRNQACAVLYDGERRVHVVAGQIARVVNESAYLWLPDEFDGDDPAEAAWMLAVHPVDVSRSSVLVLVDDEPVAFVMPLGTAS